MIKSETIASRNKKASLLISLAILLLSFSCSNEEDNVFTADRIEFSYSYLDTLYSRHYFIIDDFTFKHSDNEADWNTTTLVQQSGIDTISHLLPKSPDTIRYLPASKSYYDTPQGTNERFFENPSNIDIATNLVRLLVQINKECPEPLYRITGGPMLSTQGRFIIERFDGSAIRLEKSSDYPSRISPLD